MIQIHSAYGLTVYLNVLALKSLHQHHLTLLLGVSMDAVGGNIKSVK